MGRSPAKGHEFSILEQKLVRDGSTFVDDNLRMYAATPRVLFDAACVDLTSPERYTRQRAFKTLACLAEGRHELTSEARFICAECHLYGRGVLKDIVTAQRWFSTCCVGAAAMAFPDDQVTHCMLHTESTSSSRGVPPSLPRARPTLRPDQRAHSRLAAQDDQQLDQPRPVLPWASIRGWRR